MDVVDSIAYSWDTAIEDALGYVPIDVTLNGHAFRQCIDVLVPVIPLKLDDFERWRRYASSNYTV